MKLNGYTGTIAQRSGTLYADGKTSYQILIPEAATEAERFAAQELTDIFKLAGVTIATVTDAGIQPDSTAKYIALGNTVHFKALNRKLTQKEFKFDGFIIESFGETYIVKGVGDTGTCFGTYGFAEYAMGYRYYAEDEYTVNSSAPNLEFHIKDIPTFFGRNAFSHDTTYHPDHGFRLRINGEFCHREPKHGEGSPWSTLHDQSNALQIMDFHKYRDDHPEWFYVRPENYYGKPPRSNPQICFSKGMLSDSEGGFFDTFMHNLLENYIIPQKDKMFFMLGMSDTHDFCMCPDCQREVAKYTRSGVSMRFVNKVADAVEAWRQENAPDRVIYLISFAYHTTFDAPVVFQNGKYIPVDESVVGRDNVIIQYAPIDANYLYDLLDETHNEKSRRSLLGWSAVAKHLAVWDYRQDFHSVVFPYPSATSAQANNNIYRDLGVMDIFNQAQRFCPGSPFIDMDNFARARLHWNADEDYDQLTDEFRKAYYKDAEPWVTAYLNAILDFYPVMVSRGWDAYTHRYAGHHSEYYTPEDLDSFKKILDKALDAAKQIADPAIREKVYNRVEVLTLWYKCVKLMVYSPELPREEALALLADVRQIVEKNHVEYYQMWNKTETYLQDAEDLILGKVTQETRKYPLKDGYIKVPGQ